MRDRVSAEAGRRLAAGLARCAGSPRSRAQELRCQADGRRLRLLQRFLNNPRAPEAAARPTQGWGFRWEEHPRLQSRRRHVDRLPRARAGRPPRVRGRAWRSVRLRRRAAPRRRRGPDGQRGRLSGRVRVFFRRALARRVRQLPAVQSSAGAGGKVQAPLQPRREHEQRQSRLRLSIACRHTARARPRSRRHGARPCVERASVRGGALQSRRRERANEQPGPCVRRTRRPPGA